MECMFSYLLIDNRLTLLVIDPGGSSTICWRGKEGEGREVERKTKGCQLARCQSEHASSSECRIRKNALIQLNYVVPTILFLIYKEGITGRIKIMNK